MANQPGYQSPGQSNATPDNSGTYYQNQISGGGYGGGQSFFGGPQTGGMGNPAAGAPQAAGQLLGSQFQMPSQSPASVAMQPQTPMSGGAPSGGAPSGGQGGQFAVKTGALESGGGNQGGTPSTGPVSEVPGSRGYSGAPTYQYTDYNGNTYFVFSNNTTNMVDSQGNEVMYVDGLMSYDNARAQATGTSFGSTIQGGFGALSEFSSPIGQYRQSVMARDVTTPIEQALRSQLQDLGEERSAATQNALTRQRGLGFSGMGGMDLGGLGAQYAQTSGDIRTGAMQAMEDARRAKAQEVFQLGHDARQETGAIMSGNADYARGQIDLLQIQAQNMTGGGNTVMVNQHLIFDLSELSRLAMIKAVSSAEFNALVNTTMMKYGNDAFVAPGGQSMGSPDFELLSKSPNL